MASINGLSGTTSSGMNSANSIKGYGGLASGLDRDELIKNMTYATRSKIAAQKQKLQTFQWQQSSIQNITSKLYEFSNKYMSYSSSSNLSSSKLFSRNLITALGENSKYLSVSGSGVSADTISVLGVKSLAKNAQISSVAAASDQMLSTGSIARDLGTMVDVDVVSGESLFLTYGTKNYSVTLSNSYDYSDVDKTVESMNRALSNVSIGSGRTLADVMKVETEGAGADKKIKFVNVDSEGTGNSLVISGNTGDLLADLGFLDKGQKFEDMPASDAVITSGGRTAKNAAQLTENVLTREALSGKEISFSYNGTVKWIKLEKYAEGSTLKDVQSDIQKKLDEAFGKSRVLVELDPAESDPPENSSLTASLKFTTTTPDRKPDGSSTLAITAADRGILGNNSIFGIKGGESNRVNLSASIADSGLISSEEFTPTSTKMIIINDGAEVDLSELKNSKGEALSWDSSISDIMNAINNSKELGITVSYQSNSDKFVIQSTEQGASGTIKLSGELADALFGAGIVGEEVTGQDAVISVKYAGSDTATEIIRGSNTMSIDGMNITVKNTFGYDGTGNYIAGTEAVTFDAKVDVDATATVVKEMIDAYNEVVALIHGEVNQKPDRAYNPLTDEQKEEMSESQIEKWETEAKKGLLFNDTDMRGLADGLRFIIPNSLRTEFEKMGITVSTNYADNGKLVFNETEFKAALGKDPDTVKNAFTAAASKNEDGTTNSGGLMTSMKTVMDRYASMTGATKGILVERAGSSYAPTSVLQNGIQKQIDDINDYIDRLKDKLAMEQDRYVSQFTALETLISQMNSQSSYLMSMFSS